MTDLSDTPKRYVIESELMERIFEALRVGHDITTDTHNEYLYDRKDCQLTRLDNQMVAKYKKYLAEFDSIIGKLKNDYGMGE